MLLTLTSTTAPATDLGYLLYKHPGRVQTFKLSFGHAHVFYPEATPERCTAAILLDVDPVHLVRGQRAAAAQYVSDRPYVASSYLSVALAQVLGSALSGESAERPDLAQSAQPLEARLSAVPCRGGEAVLRRLFEPLGYAVIAEPHPLDETRPDWGLSPYFTVTLTGAVRLSDLLAHLYVLIPVLDAEKHYWIGEAEVEKLLRRGEGWLAAHPARDFIVRRYLRHGALVRSALAQLADDDTPDPDAAALAHSEEEAAVEAALSLHEQRLGSVLAILRAAGARRVLDLGCGEGRLLQGLLADPAFTEIVGLDVSHRALELAAQRLRLEQLPPRQRERIKLLHGALTYRDKRLAGYDAAAVVEVIEHLDPARLAAFERVLFDPQGARPGLVVASNASI